ncbi:hypothetical protein SDC9_211661 [bioreactor metagenome]|uniref:Uncharacterized protein n=1 Tax=bioreactor metagenome TaxID=1076179 RepID=A0A645JW49_9ZZZZ
MSVYTRPGKALVIVVRDAPNNYSGSVTATVELDRAKLGLPTGPLRALDMESMGRTPLGTVTGNRLEVPVNCDDFTAILIEP